MPESHFSSISFRPGPISEPLGAAKVGRLAIPSREDGEKSDPVVRLLAVVQAELNLRKLAVFARRYEDGEVLANLPLFVRVQFRFSWADQVDGGDRFVLNLDVSLGHVATDHVGYASFDLTRATETSVLLPELRKVPPDILAKEPKIDLQLLILPFADDGLAVDAMQVGDVTDLLVVARMDLAALDLDGRSFAPPMASMQDPDIDDWRLSPASFASNPGQLVGEDGCQQLYPANFATSQFKFSQVVRVVDARLQAKSETVARIRYGYQIDYRNEWLPIGHSLGRVLYSLPLAPGEKVNLAIIDWRRTDDASRTEDTSLTEALDHSQARDRTISEVIQATVKERQGGHSFMGGLASTMTGSLGFMNMGGSNALGFASTSSSGTRSIAADTTQQLSDTLQQTSTAVRELRSTVITHASQAERGRAETRTVANYNHCHTLTIMYYEVLHFHRVSTSVDRVRPVLFIEWAPVPLPDLADRSVVLAYRRTIEAALLDPRHVYGVRALVQIAAAEQALAAAQARFDAQPPEARELVFNRFLVIVATGDNGTDNNISVTLVKKNDTQVPLRQVEPSEGRDSPSEYLFGSSHDDFKANAMDVYMTRPDSPVRWGDLRGALFKVSLQDDPSVSDIADDYRLKSLRVIGFTEDGRTSVVVDHQASQLFGVDQDYPELRAIPADPSQVEAAPAITDFVPAAALAAASLLMEHLKKYETYYKNAVLEDLDADARWEDLAAVTLAGSPLTDLIDNDVVGRAGKELAFPLTESGDFVARKLFDLDRRSSSPPAFWKTEDLIALPTRGVFGEAVMGRCNACEKIDDSRFWDWQSSPIPGEAPSISGADLGSRNQDARGLLPSEMPQGIVNIAAPAPAPDPVAMANALQLLGQGDTFRDMSGIAQLGPFLTEMSKATAAAVAGAGGNRSQLLDQVLNNPDLSPEQKADLADKVLGGSSTQAGVDEGGQGSAPGGGSSGASPAPESGQSGDEPEGPKAPVEPVRPRPKNQARLTPVRDRTIEIAFVRLGSFDFQGFIRPTLTPVGATGESLVAGIDTFNPLNLDSPEASPERGLMRLVERKGAPFPDHVNLRLDAELNWSPKGVSSLFPPQTEEFKLFDEERLEGSFTLDNKVLSFINPATGRPHKLIRVQLQIVRVENPPTMTKQTGESVATAVRNFISANAELNIKGIIKIGGGGAIVDETETNTNSSSQTISYTVELFDSAFDDSRDVLYL